MAFIEAHELADCGSFDAPGGGLVCTTFSHDTGEKLGLPFLSELFYKEGGRYPVLKELIPNDIPYDEGSSFSITINHRKTFTGITDRDRALTISEFAGFLEHMPDIGEFEARERFGDLFRAPGHIHLLRCSRELLLKRQGHTELATSLCVMAGLIPTATICEMMSDDGNSLSREKAEKYGKDNDLVFIEGSEIIEAWQTWKNTRAQ